MTPFFRVLSALVLGLALLATTGCDPQRISELQPGVSTETDVRERFGEPENVWTPTPACALSSTTASRPARSTT